MTFHRSGIPYDRVVTDVSVEWFKWPSDPYRRTPMRRLGIDDCGVWLFAPRGAAASYSSVGPMPLPVNFLTVVPHAAHWIATWMWGNPDVDIDLYVDVVDVPTWMSSSELRVVDLDLDVVRTSGGQVYLDDEDEFAENMSRRQYPTELVEAARSTARDVLAAVGQHIAPFGPRPSQWLDAASERADHRTAALDRPPSRRSP